jgi:Na+/H+-dicarboxylate symporter
MNRNLFFYTLITGIFGLLLWFIFVQGKQLEAERSVSAHQVEAAATPDSTLNATSQEAVITPFLESLGHNLAHPLTLLLLQITSIVLFSRVLGFLFGKIGQPKRHWRDHRRHYVRPFSVGPALARNE